MTISFRQTLLFAAFVLPALTQTRNVIVLPAATSADTTATVLNVGSLASVGTVAVGADAYAAFTLPSGTKSYVIAKSASKTVTVLTNTEAGSTFSKSIDLPAGSTDAYLTPDGKRLLIVSLNDSNLTVIETVNDLVLVKIPLSAPANTVVTNFESTRAFAASPNGAIVTAVDLVANVALGTISIPSEITLVSGLGAAPNGLIYLSAVNRLFEIDPRTLQLTPAAAIVMTGSPGRPQFTPDGNKALMNNFTPISGGSALILADLTTRTVQTTQLSGLTIDRFRVVSNSLAFGYAPGSQTVYNISLSPLLATPVSIATLPATTAFRGFGGSDEAPQNKFLFLSNGNTLYKIDIATNVVVGTQTLTSPAGIPVSTSTPSAAPLDQLFAINQQQFVPTSGTTMPLVVRALDANGVPVAGATVTYTTATNGVAIANATVTTNSQGYAQTSAVVPSLQSSLTIVASAGAGITQVFTINVGFTGGGGSGGTGKIAIYDGNGQIIYSNSPPTKPMRVKITDANGNPVQTAAVTWSIISGGGTLGTTETYTDAEGFATNISFAGPVIFGNSAAFIRNAISATTSLGTVTFGHITIPRYIDGNSTPIVAPAPSIFQIFPQGRPEIKGALGATLKGAFQFKITSQTGFQANTGIAGIGVEASSVPSEGSLDTVSAQTAVCANAPLSGDDGIVTCDLVLGGKVGTSQLRLTVGGSQFFDFPLVVTQGAAKTITIVAATNNQPGVAGQPLPRSLVARIDDGFGNFLNGVPVTWTIQSGTATLFETQSTSGVGVLPDPNNASGSISSPGLVSTNLRLGNAPGDVKVRVSISPTIFADFTVTNSVSLSSLTKVSGDNQTAAPGVPFTLPLIVEVKDGNGNLAANTPISFNGTGVTLSSTSVTTNAQGRAQVIATAGATPGTYSVTASSGNRTQTFSLTVGAAGPTITSIVNGASFQPGLSPCAIAQITGTNFANTLTGSVSGQAVVGPLQTTVNGVSVEIGGVAAPLFNVNNINGVQSLSFQVPCEQNPGPVTLTLRSGTTSTSQQVTIAPYAPGIFQTLDGTGRPTAVAVKANGTYVTTANPADRGEDLRIFVTGLGQASPFITTNTPGTGNQRVNGSVIIGVNNEGISASMQDTIYAPTLIGVYIVTFRLPLNATPGLNRPFVVAVQAPDGSFSFSQSAVLDIR